MIKEIIVIILDIIFLILTTYLIVSSFVDNNFNLGIFYIVFAIPYTIKSINGIIKRNKKRKSK